jgi:hypothetical protein
MFFSENLMLNKSYAKIFFEEQDKGLKLGGKMSQKTYKSQ